MDRPLHLALFYIADSALRAYPLSACVDRDGCDGILTRYHMGRVHLMFRSYS